MNTRRLVILGSGSFAEDVADLASDIEGIEIVAFVEGIDPKRCDGRIGGIPIVWIDDLAELDNNALAVCAVGTTRRSQFVRCAEEQGLGFTIVVHPSAVVATTASLGVGTIVSAGVVIGAGVEIGRHTIVNRGSLLGHHCEFGDFVTVGPGCNVGGHSLIGNHVYLGLGSTVVDRIQIGEKSGVAAGALVTCNIDPRTFVVGVPAEPLKSLPNGM